MHFSGHLCRLRSALPANVDLDQCIQTPLGNAAAQYNAQSWEKLP
jgi:hypothetical protein